VRRIVLSSLLVAGACAVPAPPRPYSVQIFADDTVTAMLTVSVTGTLQVGVAGEGFLVRPDRSFIVGTPASLTISGGVGTATITSVNKQRIAAVPQGLPPDSAEKATVTGTTLKVSRMGYEGARIRVETP
jgi:hypothetical protein